MEHRTLGKTGLSVSIITFGGIMLDQASPEDAARIVTEAVQGGINYFDVAPSYGNAQYALGPALAPYRKDVFLACKTAKRTAKEAREELEESLKALHTDYFDNYQLHSLNDPAEIETVFAPGGAMETLRWAKEQGIARNIGFTCHHDAAALDILGRAEFDTMLMPVNFACLEQKGLSTDAIPAARQHGMGVIAIKALARRLLQENEGREYPHCWYRPICDDPELARLALNFTLSRDVDTAVTPGDERMMRLALSIIKAQDGRAVRLSSDELARLHTAAAQTSETIF